MTRWLLVFCALVAAPTAMAFPEAIRHKYNNCITCHVSPTGGGLVTEYGRALSAEIFSTVSGSETESDFLYHAVKLPEWLNVGGDFRTIQTYMETPDVKQGRFFLMQDDLEAAITKGPVTVLATAGREDFKDGTHGDRGEFISRRHFVLWTPAEAYYVRAGRFQKAFGINTPEHVNSVKRGLGWDENTETYNLELSRLNDSSNLIVTGIFGRPDDKSKDADQGFSVSGNVFVADKYKIGGSAFQGVRSNTEASRRVVGPWLLAGVSEKLFIEAEADYTTTYANKTYSGKSTNGLMVYAKEMFEVHKGINPYFVQDIAHADLSQSKSMTQGFGPGINWQPRPHLEVQAEYQKQKNPQVSDTQLLDWAYLFLHFYL